MKAKLVDMKLKPVEKKERNAPYDPGLQPAYPWGLSVRLEREQVDKLGITDLPKVGSSVILIARVEVTSTGISESQKGKEEKNITLQIVEMALSPDKGDADTSELFYPEKKA